MFHQRIIEPTAQATVSEAELVAAFSYALDITEGQPAGHCIRSLLDRHPRSAARSGCRAASCGDLYYTLLLKDLGCSSNAARICELYEADDRAFKQGYKTVGTSLAATLHFVFSQTARGRPLHRARPRDRQYPPNGDAIAQEMIVARCTRGADIARSLRFSEAVCEGIYRLDEHWDGSGRPGRLRGEAIPLLARIALLAQVVDVFHSPCRARGGARRGAPAGGRLVRPGVVARVRAGAARRAFWDIARSPVLEARVVALAPADDAGRSTRTISTPSPRRSAR